MSDTGFRKSMLARPGQDRPAVDVKRLYEELQPVLFTTLVRKLDVPAADADRLLEDVFLPLMTARPPVDNLRGWLVAATCNAARTRRLSEGRDASADEKTILDAIALHDALDLLSEPAREAVRLRFSEQCTYPEIAVRIDTSVRYAQKLVAKAVALLRKAQRGTRPGQ